MSSSGECKPDPSTHIRRQAARYGAPIIAAMLSAACGIQPSYNTPERPDASAALDTSEQPDVSAAEPTKKAEPTSIPRPKPSKQLAWLYGIGSMGTGVKGLQNDLRTAGCGVAPDGVFGPNTQQGVKTFQENEGIDNLVAKLGAVDEITLVALQKSLSAGEQYCGLKENPNPRPGDVFVRPHSLPPCGPPLAPDVACDPSPSPKTSYNPWG